MLLTRNDYPEHSNSTKITDGGNMTIQNQYGLKK